MGENLCQLYIGQRINNQNIQGAQKTKLLIIINDLMKKWANERTELFQRNKSKCSKNEWRNAQHAWPMNKELKDYKNHEDLESNEMWNTKPRSTLRCTCRSLGLFTNPKRTLN
jgi:hypothetical protein